MRARKQARRILTPSEKYVCVLSLTFYSRLSARGKSTMGCYGDTLSFKLPNSQMGGIVACKYFEIPGTTKDNAGQGVQPDHYVANSLEDSWNKIERVMEFVHELCSSD